jgi:hypothetical protein
VRSVYVRDLAADTTTLVSRATGAGGAAAAGGASAGPISADGGALVFTTSAPLDAAAADGHTHVYLRDLDAASTTLVDRDTGAAGTVPAFNSSAPVIDADGSRVAWVSLAPIAGAPADNRNHVFLRDLPTNDTKLVSRADGLNGVPADGSSSRPAIDAAGDVVAFDSEAPNLGAGSAHSQVLARTIASGRTELVSFPPTGGNPLPTAARSASIDAAGDRISFSAFDASAAAPGHQVFIRDLPSQTTELVSRADGVGGAPGDSLFTFASSISPSGDCVAFDGRFTNLGDGFSSRDFTAVHMRTLRGSCPVAPRDDDGSDPPPPPPPPPPAKPVLSKLALTPSRFRVSGRRHGTTIRYRLSRSARVTLRIDRVTKSRRRTVVRRAGVLTNAGRKGANKLRFAGKLRGKRLRPGTYRLRATPAGGRARTVWFTVIRPATRVKARPRARSAS